MKLLLNLHIINTEFIFKENSFTENLNPESTPISIFLPQRHESTNLPAAGRLVTWCFSGVFFFLIFGVDLIFK